MIALAAAFEHLLEVLDRIEIPFLVDGSVASGTHGLARQTNDIDIVADVKPSQVTDFCEALQPAFYVDAEAVARAIEIERPFNVIHLGGAYKFDIFPVGQDPFAQSELARRRYATTTITGLETSSFQSRARRTQSLPNSPGIAKAAMSPIGSGMMFWA